jgi:uncharacterized protein
MSRASPDGLTPGTAEAALVAVLAAHNWLSNRVLPRWAYIPSGLAVSAVAIALSRRGGATTELLGLDRERLQDGVRIGAVASILAATAVATGSALPRTRHLYVDERVLRARSPAYEVALRIPLGTAVAEELLFRSALLGLSLRQRSWVASIAWSSALFGLWHVLPTITTLPDSAALSSVHVQHGAVAPVASSVAVTSIGGILFALLRKQSGSVVAPILLHATGNVAAFVASRRIARGS